MAKDKQIMVKLHIGYQPRATQKPSAETPTTIVAGVFLPLVSKRTGSITSIRKMIEAKMLAGNKSMLS